MWTKKKTWKYRELIGKRVRATIGKYGRFEVIEGVVTDVCRGNIRIQLDNGEGIWIWKPTHRGEKIEILKEEANATSES